MKRFLAVAWLIAIFAGSPRSALAGSSVDWLGNGSVDVSAWNFPTQPPAGATTSGAASGFRVSASLGPALGGGFSGLTSISGSNGGFWHSSWNWSEAGGDSTGDANAAPFLLSLLTPVSSHSSGTLDVSGGFFTDPPGPVGFRIQFTGSDSGVGALEQWFDTDGTPLLQFPLIELGPGSQDLGIVIFDPNGFDHIVMKTEVIGLSVPTGAAPEASSLGLLAMGIVVFCATLLPTRSWSRCGSVSRIEGG